MSEPDEEFEALLEQSSLGSPGAQRLRRRTSRTQADRAQAFSAFYRTEIKSLVNFLLWTGAGLSDAADIAQETMREAYAKWSSISDRRTWVRRVASRRYGRLRFSAEIAPELEVSPLLRTGYDVADWEGRQPELKLLSTLPERHRQVLAWSLDGYSLQEIAEELALAPHKVAATLETARRMLLSHTRQAQNVAPSDRSGSVHQRGSIGPSE